MLQLGDHRSFYIISFLYSTPQYLHLSLKTHYCQYVIDTVIQHKAKYVT